MLWCDSMAGPVRRRGLAQPLPRTPAWTDLGTVEARPAPESMFGLWQEAATLRAALGPTSLEPP